MAIDKVVDSTILDGYFEDIADAIRAKDGSQATLAPTAMPQAIADIPSGGGDTGLTALLDSATTGPVTIQAENLNRFAYVLANAGVTELHAPNLLLWSHISSNNGSIQYASEYGGIIGDSSNDYFSVIDLPKCKRFNFTGYKSGYNASPGALQTINLPKLEYGSINITGSSNKKIPITSLSLPELLGAYLGFIHTNLQTISLPSVTTLGCNFSNNTQLTELNLPEAQSGGGLNLSGCTSLTKMVAPKWTIALNQGPFYGTTSLEYVDIKGFTGSSTSTFQGSSCTALILRSDTIVTLSTTSIFNNSTFAAGTGYFYVPDSLKATYKTETNWSTFANQFRSIEDYTNDGTLTGDFVMPSN